MKAVTPPATLVAKSTEPVGSVTVAYGRMLLGVLIVVLTVTCPASAGAATVTLGTAT